MSDTLTLNCPKGGGVKCTPIGFSDLKFEFGGYRSSPKHATVANRRVYMYFAIVQELIWSVQKCVRSLFE